MFAFQNQPQPQAQTMFTQQPQQNNQHSAQNVLDKLSKMYPTNAYQVPNQNNNFYNNSNNIYNNQNQNTNPFYRQKSIYDTFKNDNSQQQPNTIYSNLNQNAPNPNSIYGSFNNLNQGPGNEFDLPSENDINKNIGQDGNQNYPNI